MPYHVELHPNAVQDLDSLYERIAADNPEKAISYILKIKKYCNSLNNLPERGRERHDLAPDVRTISFDRRIIIAYRIEGEKVIILHIFYAGRNFLSKSFEG